MSCSIEDDNVFGPQVGPNCRGGFDFTLLFEELILTIIPLVLISLLLPFRLWKLLHQSQRVNLNSVYYLKLFGSAAYAILQVLLLLLLCVPNSGIPKTRASIPTITLTFVVSTACVFLSHLEHTRNIRPSSILTLYYSFSLLSDTVRSRTLWLLPHNRIFSIAFIASAGIKVILAIFESIEKTHSLRKPYVEVSREITSGVFNRNLFWWLNSLLGTGFSKDIGLENLSPIDERLRLMERTEDASNEMELLWPLVAAVIPRLCLSGFTFAQPFLFTRVVDFVLEPNTRESNNIGYGLIAAAVLVYLGLAITTANNQHKTYRAITMIRGSLVALIYSETLPLSTTAIKESAAVTLMSADVERVGTGMRYMHEVWASPIDFALSFWLLERQLGVASVAPAAVFLLCSLAGLGVAASMGSRQRQWLEGIQKRVKVTSDVLGSMKEIRMAGIQSRLKSQLEQLRAEEISASRKFKNALTLIVTLSYTTAILAPVIAFTMFSLIAKRRGQPPLDTSRAFTSLTLFALLRAPMALIIDAIAGVVSAIGSLQRIGEYLSSSEKSGHSNIIPHSSNQEMMLKEKMTARPESVASFKSHLYQRDTDPDFLGNDMIVATRVCAGWEKDKPFVLKNLSFNIQKATSTFIIGPVGSGKSTFLRAILGETNTLNGKLSVAFSEAAYCGQTPWIMNDTVRRNILGTSLYDKTWYDIVLQMCVLQDDVNHFPNGDQEIVGSKGVNLSGGQQARLALARAIYSRKQVILLDDVMSGLDARTEEILFKNLFSYNGVLKSLGLTAIFATNAVSRISYADHIIVLNRNGEIVEQGSFSQLSFTSQQVDEIEEDRGASSTAINAKAHSSDSPALVPSPQLTNTGSRRSGDTTIYKYYAKTVGVLNSVIFVVLCGGFVFSLVFPQYLVRWWTDENAQFPNKNLGYYLGGYACLGILGIASLAFACWHLVAHMMPRASTEFHNALLETTVNAPLSLFSETDIGTTTNRFSQDLQLIDMELPLALFNTTVEVLSCVAQLITIAISAKYIGAALPALLIAFYCIQKFYLRTARQLRLLDIEAKAPLFSKFIEALDGLVTIRAFGWQKSFELSNTEVINTSQRPYYLLYCVQRWLNLVLDFLVTAIAFIVVVIAVKTKGKIDPGLIGIALVNIVNFSVSIKALISNWTMLEISIGAVSRVRSFKMETASEHHDWETVIPPPEWPSAGHIEFRNVTASYKSSRDPVIKDLSLNIEPGQKLAICGQSGSGKSSIIYSLFRLLDPSSGSITIDGLNLSNLSRHYVRSRLICVTQTPHLLPGATIRDNVDPFNNATDKEIIAALEEVQLWDTIEEMGGLEVILDQDALSVGQKQLICLARAMLRKGSILILDEATASVDVDTDDLMQQIIRKHFTNHTVIAIAHRLNTILDFDRVAVISRGELVEYDSPENLLQRPSAFRDLYEKSSYGRVKQGSDRIESGTWHGPSELTLVPAMEQLIDSRIKQVPRFGQKPGVDLDDELSFWLYYSAALAEGLDERSDNYDPSEL